MRLIDADVLKEKIDDIWANRSLSFLGARILTMIDNEPHIDIVRCKECRWFKKWKTIGRDDGYCEYARNTQDGLQYINVNPDDFCSYGEREDND